MAADNLADHTRLTAPEDQVRSNAVPPRYVQNSKTGRVHRVARMSPELCTSAWTTVCGWQFGGRPHRNVYVLTDYSNTTLCDKCLPSERAAAAAACESPGTSSADASDRGLKVPGAVARKAASHRPLLK